MKSLKLRKVKISKIGNPHILFGGADAAQGAHEVKYPITFTLDTLLDDTCTPGTNGTLGQRTGVARRNQDGVQN